MDKTNTNPELLTSDEALRRLEELDAAFEIGAKYGRTERAVVNIDGNPETDGEHVTSLGMICVAYATKYRPDLDVGKLSFYILFHDVDEWLHGDVSSLGISPEQYNDKDALEDEAATEREHRMEDFPEFNALLRTLKDLSVPEFAFAKAFDKLSPHFTHLYNGGSVLKERYGYENIEEVIEGNRTVFEKMEKYAAEFADVISMKQATFRRIAGVAFGASEA